ncbi:MAG: hypothetical protein AAFU66_10850 [Pseudomonadota bacterium]
MLLRTALERYLTIAVAAWWTTLAPSVISADFLRGHRDVGD